MINLSLPEGYALPENLDSCDKEPIHIPGRIQSFGVLLVCNPDDYQILQVSDNCAQIFGKVPDEMIGSSLVGYLDDTQLSNLQRCIDGMSRLGRYNPFLLDVGARPYNMTVHLHQGLMLIDIEERKVTTTSSSFQYDLGRALQNVLSETTEDELYQTTCEEVKYLTGYDRVMLYRFDEEWNGQVVGEAKEPHLEPYRKLNYPHTDIPSQARELFKINQIRTIKDVTAPPALLVPQLRPDTGAPTDLSFSSLRGVSPVHIEYLINMGVRATLTIAIVDGGELWGLIACHHYSPRLLDYSLRASCRFLSQVFSTQLVQSTGQFNKRRRDELILIKERLFNQMSREWKVYKGLTKYQVHAKSLVDSEGFAIKFDDKYGTEGLVPSDEQITDLIDWLCEFSPGNLFYSHNLSTVYPPAKEYTEIASGVLAIPLSRRRKDYVMWFRPEVEQTVTWAGKPDGKVLVEDGDRYRLSPRKSFEKWSESKAGMSEPWQPYVLEVAESLREGISDIVMHKYHEVKDLVADLRRANSDMESFNYSVSHDLRAPLRSIEGFARILIEDFNERFQDEAGELLNVIIHSANDMSLLINDMLSYSRSGRSTRSMTSFSLEELVGRVIEDMKKAFPEIEVVYDMKPLPVIYADYSQLRQVYNNLISNAIKYSHKKGTPHIEIGIETGEDGETLYYVKDNGIGFDMRFAERIFGVFNRLVNKEEYEGTGVGLAIVARVIDRHDGRIWPESVSGEGTTFYFTLNTGRFMDSDDQLSASE